MRRGGFGILEKRQRNPAGVEMRFNQPAFRTFAVAVGSAIGALHLAQRQQLAGEGSALVPELLGVGRDALGLVEPVDRVVPQFELPGPLRPAELIDRIAAHRRIDCVEQLLGVLGVARHGIAGDRQGLLRRCHVLHQSLNAAGAIVHHQVHGTSPMRVSIDEAAQLVQHAGLGGLVEKVLGPDGAGDASGAILLATRQIGLGQRDLRRERVGHGAAQLLDQRRAIGILAHQGLLKPGPEHGAGGEIRRIGHEALHRGGRHTTIAVIDRRPLHGATLRCVGEATRQLIRLRLLAVAEQFKRLGELAGRDRRARRCLVLDRTGGDGVDQRGLHCRCQRLAGDWHHHVGTGRVVGA